MSWSLRRVVLTLGPVTCLCTAAFVAQAVGQVQVQVAQPGLRVGLQPKGGGIQPQPQPKDPTEFSHAIDLPKDPRVARQIEAAEDYIKEEDWVTACETLQNLLLHNQDFFMKVQRKGPDGKETVNWVSVKSEADRLIATLPEKGMEFYKLNYGPKAAELLKEAKATSNVGQLKLITSCYLHTDAGAEAADLLGTYQLDRGEWTMAALCYEKLLAREGSDKLGAVTLFKAAYTFNMVGDKANENVCRDKLKSRTGVIRIGNETRTVEELFEYIAKSGRPASEVQLAYDTPMVGGGPSGPRRPARAAPRSSKPAGR